MILYYGNPLAVLISFAPVAKGHAPTPALGAGPNVAIYFGNPLATKIVFSVVPRGAPFPLVGAQYRLIEPHYINGRRYEVGEVIRETDNTGPGDVPSGWVPTLAVDPLNSFAVTAFYAAGPRGISYEDLNQWASSRWAIISPSTVVVPVTFWVKRGGLYFLTGLGANLPPITAPLFGV